MIQLQWRASGVFCVCCTLLAVGLPDSAARAQALRAKNVTVSPDGQVSVSKRKLARLKLPPGKRHLDVRRATVNGRRLLHVRVSGEAGRAAELVVERGRTPRVVWSGSTGPQGVDGEWSLHLDVTSKSLLLYQRRSGVERCDGESVYLFPQLYDWRQRRFRAAAPVIKRAKAPQLAARRALSGMPQGPPLQLFRLSAASTHLGDEQRAGNLGPPAEAEDNDPKTSWAESLGDAGRGQFLTALAPKSPYRLKAVAIIPGDAASGQAFRSANRIKSALLVLSATRSYRVRFARDPLRDAGSPQQLYWVVLPEAVATSCATLIVEDVYSGASAVSQGGGRTAISELRFYTELDFGGGQTQVMSDLGSSDTSRASSAVTVLGRLGAQGVALVLGALPGASEPLLGRIVDVLSRTPSVEVVGPVAKAIVRMSRSTRSRAFDMLQRIGTPAAAGVAPLLASGPASLQPEIARLLGRLGGPSARDALLKAAGSGEVGLRAAIAAAIADLGQPGDLAAVLTALEAASREARRADLTLASGLLGRRLPNRSATAEKLVELAEQHRGFELRYRLLRALGRLDPAGQLSVFSRHASDSDPILRWTAVQQIRRVSSAAATALLQRKLADSDPRVRATAAAALEKRSGRSLDAALARLLDAERWGFVGRAAAEALSGHCTATSIAALRRAVKRSRRGVDERALISLVSCKPPGISEELMRIAANARQRTTLRRRAVSLLPRELTHQQREALVSLFVDLRRRAVRSDDEERVAAVTAEAVARSAGKLGARALADALALDANPSIRAAAAAALGLLCHASTRETVTRARHDQASIVARAATMSAKRCRW